MSCTYLHVERAIFKLQHVRLTLQRFGPFPHDPLGGVKLNRSACKCETEAHEIDVLAFGPKFGAVVRFMSKKRPLNISCSPIIHFGRIFSMITPAQSLKLARRAQGSQRGHALSTCCACTGSFQLWRAAANSGCMSFFSSVTGKMFRS